MDYLKANFDRVLLIGAGLLLASVSVYSVLSRNALQLEFPLPALTVPLAPFEKSPEIVQLAGEEAKLSEPGASAWTAPEDGGSLFVSRIYLLGEAGLVDLYDSDLQLYEGIPNEWLLKHNLDYTDKRLATSDPDNDGFTNLEEFRVDTDPMDPASRPAVWSKLRLVSSKIDKLRTKFESLPRGDLDVVQINTVSAEDPQALTGASQFYRLNDFIKRSESGPDGKKVESPTSLQFAASKFITRFNPSTDTEEKIPQITLLNTANGAKIELLQGEMKDCELKDSIYSLATLQDTRPGGQTLDLRWGDEFPLEEGTRYKLIDVSVETATIKDLSSGESHIIPRPETDAISVPPSE
jgi:hypothetical protein